MMSMIDSVKAGFANYKLWVKNNPVKAQEAELAFKWISFYFSGRINSSPIPTESAYTLSRLIVLLNDRIIQESTTSSAGPAHRVRLLLTVLEYCEVVLEISAQRLWGTKMKWLTVAAMQYAKATLRTTLFFKYDQHLIPSPALSPLNRESFLTPHPTTPQPASTYLGFELKSSKRVIRKVEAAPKSTNNRSWMPITPTETLHPEEIESRKTGELLNMARPLFHLLATYKYGEKSWKPWLISLAVDCMSLYHLNAGTDRHLSEQRKIEHSKRMFNLLLYIMRSPFYERYSEHRVKSFLDALNRILPLARFVCEPAKNYLPFFQSTYSYVWST